MQAEAYKLDFEPLLLKRLMHDCDIPQGQLAAELGISRPAVNLLINRGYIPMTKAGFRETVEQFIAVHPGAVNWLLARGLDAVDIWRPLGSAMRGQPPRGQGLRQSAAKRASNTPRQVPADMPGDHEAITIDWEVEMIPEDVLKKFRLFRNPFIDDIQKDTDVFMGEDHRYIEAAMLDAARHGGFLAVIGEVGAGKSVIRKRVVEQLRRDGDVLVIFPQIIDKARLSASYICDSIVLDISSQTPTSRLEQKTRQVRQLLLERSKQNYRCVLMIEEAHDLHASTFKFLKRFNELEDGYRKLLGIVLIGQIELRQMFNEQVHVDMREVIRRAQVADIGALSGGDMAAYLAHKFRRVGAKLEDVFAPEAVTALTSRLTSTDRKNRRISHAYPLMVNNFAARAMIEAHVTGELKVTEQLVTNL